MRWDARQGGVAGVRDPDGLGIAAESVRGLNSHDRKMVRIISGGCARGDPGLRPRDDVRLSAALPQKP
jgi:hypothetical protein